MQPESENISDTEDCTQNEQQTKVRKENQNSKQQQSNRKSITSELQDEIGMINVEEVFTIVSSNDFVLLDEKVNLKEKHERHQSADGYCGR